jgi:glucokinase
MTHQVVGIDIGGTKIAAGLVNEEARVRFRHESKGHAGQSPDVVIESADGVFRRVLDEANLDAGSLAGVGVGFAGHTDAMRGIVLTSSNLPAWDRVPLREVLSERFGVPVWLDNDCNAAALAEHRYGAGRGTRHMVYVVFSTGTGAGIIVDGELYRGHIGAAGELGHTVIDVDGRMCSCGKRGCLMGWACGMALTELASERLRRGESTLIRDMAGGDPGSINGEMVAEAARRGDHVALELVQLTGRYLGVGLSTIVQVLNPELIVIGGGLTHMGAMLMDPCLQSLRENVHPVLADSTRVLMSDLGEDAGVVGAAALVLSDLRSTEATSGTSVAGKG